MEGPEKPSMRPLPAATIRLIASSQVVTSVASAVKELIENALDAAATSIDVKLENSGLNRVEVRDNGRGISPVDAEFMGQPHFTSKITDTEDLSHLQTYGFRGEALGSLCAVSNVAITTKTEAMEVGITYTLNDKGVITNKQASHLGQGTAVTTTNLFKSLPVRRQFYNTAKKRKEELRKVEDIVTSFSVIRHDVRFSLRHEKEVVYVSNPVASCRDVLIRVFGSAVMRDMAREMKKDLDNEISLEMYVPKVTSDVPLCSRASNERCYIYINKRPVTQKDIEKLLRTYYCHGLSCSGRWPLAFVSITLPPEEVDVNLEPNKTRVLVHEKVELLEFVRCSLEAVYGSLEAKLPSNHQKKLVDLNDNEDLRSDKSGGNPACGDVMNDIEESSLPLSTLMNGTDIEFFDKSHELSRVNQDHERTVIGVGKVDVIDTVTGRNTTSGGEEIAERNTKSIESSPLATDLLEDSPLPLDIPTPPGVKRLEDYTSMTRDSDLSSVISTQNMNFDLAGDDFITSTPWAEESEVPKLDLNDISNIASGVSAKPELIKNCDHSDTGDMADKTNALSHQNQFSVGGDTNGMGDDQTSINMAVVPGVIGLAEENQAASADWSRGSCLKTAAGKPVQPVTLLVPGGSSSSMASNLALVAPSQTTCHTPKANHSVNKLQDTPDQPTLVDMMGSSTVKRPSSAYIFFCKKIRPTVYEENPGASFDRVARIMSERWAAMETEERKEYETQAKEDSNRYQEQMALQKQLSASKLTSSARKRRKLDLLNSPCLKEKIPRVDKEQKPQVPCTRVHFSMGELQDLFSKGFQSTQQLAPNGRFNLIGQLKSHGIWLGAKGNQIQGFHPIRTQEMLIYANLLANHEIPADHIPETIYLRPSYVGGDAAWSALLSLPASDAIGTNFYGYITDPRVCHNGMKLRRGTDDNTGEVTLDVVEMSSMVNFLGVSDLKEIAGILVADPDADLTQCRPSKIKHYLQSEAVRMARQLPQRVSRDEAQDLLEQAQSLPSLVCFHNKPSVFTLCDLDDAAEVTT